MWLIHFWNCRKTFRVFNENMVVSWQSCLLLHYFSESFSDANEHSNISSASSRFRSSTTDFYEPPTLLYIQTKYIVYNVVRGVIEFKGKGEIV